MERVRLFTRREFLEFARDALGLSIAEQHLPQVDSFLFRLPDADKEVCEPKEKIDVDCAVSSAATMTHLGKIPEGDDFHHDNQIESLSCVIDRKMYSREPELTDHLDIGTPNDPNLKYQYWEGVREAIGRGQRVFITVELPGESETDVTLDDWRRYISAIGREFNGAYFIIGNEVNISKRWKDEPGEYAEFYLASAKEIRESGPESKILTCGDAYCEHGEILREVLGKVDRLAQEEGLTLEDLVDGLAFHYYDVASKLEERVRLYEEIGQEYGIDKLYLTELGRLESAKLTEEQTADLVVQNLATSLYLASKGRLENVIWHTAYAIDDPGGHSLTETNDDGSIKSYKDGFTAFWKVCRLLQKDLGIIRWGELTIVYGKDDANNTNCIVWINRITDSAEDAQQATSWIINLPDQISDLDLSGYSEELVPSTTKGVEGHPVIISFGNREVLENRVGQNIPR